MRIAQAVVAVAAVCLVGGANAQSLDDLLKKNGCTACHAVDKKVIGPAYVDVANKYKSDPKAAAYLQDKVKKGGSGVWGQIPMPPNTQVSDADIKKIVDDILKLKK
jgi:cytochrome c